MKEGSARSELDAAYARGLAESEQRAAATIAQLRRQLAEAYAENERLRSLVVVTGEMEKP